MFSADDVSIIHVICYYILEIIFKTLGHVYASLISSHAYNIILVKTVIIFMVIYLKLKEYAYMLAG